MKDCWKLLGIQPTNDVGIIRKSYLKLVKKYHPDTVPTPEQKRKYTIRCAEINNAYKEALNQAQFIKDPGFQAAPVITAQGPQPWYSKVAMYFAVAMGFLVPIAGIVWLLNFGIPEIRLLSDTNIIRVGFTSLVAFAISVSIIGFCLMGILDMLIALLVPSKLLSKLGLEKYERKLIWLSMLIFNVYIFYFTDFGNVLFKDNDTMTGLYTGIWRSVGAGTVPFLLALDWIKDFMRYVKVRNRGFALQIVED